MLGFVMQILVHWELDWKHWGPKAAFREVNAKTHLGFDGCWMVSQFLLCKLFYFYDTNFGIILELVKRWEVFMKYWSHFCFTGFNPEQFCFLEIWGWGRGLFFFNLIFFNFGLPSLTLRPLFSSPLSFSPFVCHWKRGKEGESSLKNLGLVDLFFHFPFFAE